MDEVNLPALQTVDWKQWLAALPTMPDGGRDATKIYADALTQALAVMPNTALLDLPDAGAMTRSKIGARLELIQDDLIDSAVEGGEIALALLVAVTGFIAIVAVPALTIPLAFAEVLVGLFGVRSFLLRRERAETLDALRRAIGKARYDLTA